jgi:hypothetical protein
MKEALDDAQEGFGKSSSTAAAAGAIAGYDASTAGSGSSPTARVRALSEAYYQVVPRVFLNLNQAFERETQREVEVWMKALRDRAIIWVNGKFVDASRVAYSSPLSSVNLEPYLYLVQGEMLKFRGLLGALGVRDCFGPVDLVTVTRDLCNEHPEGPLPAGRLEVCLGVLKLLVRFLRGDDEEEDDDDDDDEDFDDAHDGGESLGGKKLLSSSTGRGDDDVTAAESSTATATEDGDSDSLDLVSEKKSDKKTKKPKKQSLPLVTLDELLPIFIPDRAGVMMPSTALTFDDAPWVSASLAQVRTYDQNEAPPRLNHSFRCCFATNYLPILMNPSCNVHREVAW